MDGKRVILVAILKASLGLVGFWLAWRYASLGSGWGAFSWLVIGAGTAAAAVRDVRADVRDLRRGEWARAGRCQHCGYDLRGQVDRCPECGASLN